jgi:phosphocarrier protein HPr
MKEFQYVITDPIGIHARPAGLLVKLAKQYADSKITVWKGDKSTEMKKLMGLMQLGVKQGDALTIKVDGGDEDAVAAAVEEFLKANL